jgi:hypothetical protein
VATGVNMADLSQKVSDVAKGNCGHKKQSISLYIVYTADINTI